VRRRTDATPEHPGASAEEARAAGWRWCRRPRPRSRVRSCLASSSSSPSTCPSHAPGPRGKMFRPMAITVCSPFSGRSCCRSRSSRRHLVPDEGDGRHHESAGSLALRDPLRRAPRGCDASPRADAGDWRRHRCGRDRVDSVPGTEFMPKLDEARSYRDPQAAVGLAGRVVVISTRVAAHGAVSSRGQAVVTKLGRPDLPPKRWHLPGRRLCVLHPLERGPRAARRRRSSNAMAARLSDMPGSR